MRAHRLSYLWLAVLALLALPLPHDAQLAPPASAAPCCAVADAPPRPVSNSDEQFFQIPGGVPNVMLLLDSSGSMLEFPRDVAWQNYGTSATYGTCALPSPFVRVTTAATLTDTPYDNGWTTAEMTDNPPWGLARCQAKQARPTTDGALDFCQFRGDSYYKFVMGTNASNGTFWDDTRARVYNANPCAAVNTSGTVITDYQAKPVLPDVAACNACLASSGYYIFRVRYHNAATTWANTPEQIVFSGKHMNGYPPKHVIARKVVKDLAKLDSANPTPTDDVRFGLTVFTATASGGFSSQFRTTDGGKLIVPLGPSCDDSFPLNRSALVTARKAIVDAVNAIDTADSTWPSTYIPFNSTTPLSESLFNVGQYFTNTGTSGLYNVLFGSNWVLPRTGDTRDFKETAAGAINAPWAAAGKNQHSFCWACQQSSVVVVTDGEPNQDSNLPSTATTTAHATFNNDFRYWSNATINCPECQCDQSYGDACTLGASVVPSGSLVPNLMHKVAYFLNQTDLRPDLTNAGSRPQNLNIYTISFGLDDSASAPAGDKKAIAVLNKTAQLGGGLFKNTSSGAELRDALDRAVTDVVQRASSFSAASANALQTSKTTQADAYMARFRPSQSSAWEGHLFAAMIFDEFGMGCDGRYATSAQQPFTCGASSGVNPNLNGDQDPSTGLAICDDAYIVDRDCTPLLEDASGAFKKGAFVNGVLTGTPDDANMYWDAGRVLSDPTQPGYRTAREALATSRKIYTSIDATGDGRYTTTDGTIPFTRANAATLAPYLSLDEPWCREQMALAGICGSSPLPACATTWNDAERTRCARMVIDFVRGWDVMDWDNDHCAGPESYYNTNGWGTCSTNAQCGAAATCVASRCVNTSCANGEERDRSADSRAAAAQEFWKLGDIFHSAPILVKAPAGKIECGTGLVNQCVLTLYGALGGASNATPLEQYGTAPNKFDAYVQWRRETINRQQAVLVGANDGMLHAFDAGVADTSRAANAEGQHPYTNGTGTELWGFIPPDLLPRLKFSLSKHGYYVDGNTMVRDVWVDGSGASSTKDGKKQKDEYHTVAIISERSGGTHFTALDVSDVANPRFLWTFPESCTENARTLGQTWAEFAPQPPPIGPVRIATNSATASQDVNGRGWLERWVVLLNGGYDPAMVRGRGIWMLDVWTGQTLWQYRNQEFQAMRGDTAASMGPIAAPPVMVDMGAADRTVGSTDVDGFFDTATFGDVFGNLFVARFYAPGIQDPSTGLMTNWTAARTFEMNRKTTNVQDMRARSQFFFTPANLLAPPSKLMVLTGSGNREQLLARRAECSSENVLGCCQAGCTVTSAVTSSAYGGGCNLGGSFSCGGGGLTFTPSGGGAACAGNFACGSTTQTVTLNFDCGAAGTMPPITGTLTCDGSGTCSVDTDPSRQAIDVSAATGCKHDCMFGVWAFGQKPEKRFDETVASAREFEKNRFTDASNYVGCGSFGSCSLVNTSPAEVRTQTSGLVTTCLDGSTKCKAETTDPGWKYCYGLYCPTGNCTTPQTTPPWCDERTGTAVASGYSSCAQYSTFRPTGATGTADPCSSSTGTPTSLSYLVDAVTGTTSDTCGYGKKNGDGSTTYFRAKSRSAFSPPKMSTVRIVVNERGEVNYSTLGDPSDGSADGADKHDEGTRASTNEPLYILEVPRAAHECRHIPDSGKCQ